MPKNIALFIDGTWNEPAWGWRTSNTNVRRLYTAANRVPGQVCHYLRGIGTDSPRFQFLERVKRLLPRNVAGGVFGLGMSDRIKDAYQFLSGNYEPGDRVYLFGFSRGAFAARSLAGFVDAVGLVLKHRANDRNLIESAYALYENGEDREHSALRALLRDLGLPDAPSAERRDELPIHFIGVWDTVAALGLPERIKVFSAPFTEFHQTGLPKNISYARHAVALHELRRHFPALLWDDERAVDDAGRPYVQQMWFPGAHANVGGGYAASEWSDLARDWMADEACACGLQLRGWPRKPGAECPRAMIENSFAFPFAGGEPEPRASLSRPDPHETFDVHAVAVRRLFNDGQTAYRFRADVNEALRRTDWCTARMIHTLRETRGTDKDIEATYDGLEPAKKHTDDCRTALKAFVTGTGTNEHGSDVLLRSFLLGRFWMTEARTVATDAEWLADELGGGFRQTAGLEPMRRAAGRLLELVVWIRTIAREPATLPLPDQHPPTPLRRFLLAVEVTIHAKVLIQFGSVTSGTPIRFRQGPPS